MRLSAQKRVGVVIEAAVEFIGSCFILRNNNNFAWENVRVELSSMPSSDNFVFKTKQIPAMTAHAISMSEFVDSDGVQFDSLPRSVTSRPHNINIRCNTQAGGGFWLGNFV